jgi:KaiC/GvpD/RAD55 family RecA-like ATPase
MSQDKAGAANGTNASELSQKELENLLRPEREIRLKIQEALDELPKDFAVAVIENSSSYAKLNIEIIKYVVSKKKKLVYLTVNKNVSDLIELLKEEEIQTDEIIFIDAITGMSGGKEISGKKYHYIDSPRNLTGAMIELDEIMETLSNEENYLVLDSITTLLIYNKESAVEKVVHSLSSKMRQWNAHGIFIIMKSTKERVKNTITQFSDSFTKV